MTWVTFPTAGIDDLVFFCNVGRKNRTLGAGLGARGGDYIFFSRSGKGGEWGGEILN